METQIRPAPNAHRIKAAHLLCGTPVWGVAGVLACSYLAYLSYSHLRLAEFDWPHDVWTILTYSVWVLLMGRLLSETRCWRERIFFGLVLANFTLGFVLAVWRTAPMQAIREVRIISAGLWAAAALVSVVVTFSSGQATVRKKIE